MYINMSFGAAKAVLFIEVSSLQGVINLHKLTLLECSLHVYMYIHVHVYLTKVCTCTVHNVKCIHELLRA